METLAIICLRENLGDLTIDISISLPFCDQMQFLLNVDLREPYFRLDSNPRGYFLYFKEAAMKLAKSGWAALGFDLNSG